MSSRLTFDGDLSNELADPEGDSFVSWLAVDQVLEDAARAAPNRHAGHGLDHYYYCFLKVILVNVRYKHF